MTTKDEPTNVVYSAEPEEEQATIRNELVLIGWQDSMFGDQPDDYYEAKDDLNQLAGKSMRLEARIVKTVMDGCGEEGSHE